MGKSWGIRVFLVEEEVGPKIRVKKVRKTIEPDI